MTTHRLKEYRFQNPEQWQAGLGRNWIVSRDGLMSPPGLTARALPHVRAADRHSAIAFDNAGNLTWLRPGTFERVRLGDNDSPISDVLDIRLNADDWRPREMVAGRTRTWVLLEGDDSETRLVAVDNDTLCELLQVAATTRVVSVAAADGDAIWGIADISGRYWLVTISRLGNVRRLIEIDEEAGTEVVPGIVSCRIARVPGSQLLTALVTYDANPCSADCRLWRVFEIDVECSPRIENADVRLVYAATRKPVPCPDDPPAFVPDALTVDCQKTVHVVERASGEIMALSLDGELRGRWQGVFDTCLLPLHDVGSATSLAAGGAGGVYSIRQTPGVVASTTETEASVYLTPTLRSPDGVISGWSRLDLDLDFGGRSLVEVRVAHSSDPRLAEDAQKIRDDSGMPGSARLQRLTDLLPWDRELTTRFDARQWPAGRKLRLPLHEVESENLWVLVTVRPDLGAAPVVIRSLRVRHPNLSLASYLPAVYQEDPAGAANLRNVITMLESVFGDLDEILAGLPGRIDPRTAPAEWLPYLLRWLGLPVAIELSTERQRRLLLAAPTLIEWRGTMTGLEQLLALLVDGDVAIQDLGAAPAPWALPVPGRHEYAQRLGSETLVLCARQPGFTPGENAALGSATLGYSTLRTGEIFSRRSAAIRIAIALESDHRSATEALLGRYLPYFIPAHCRYELSFVDRSQLPMPGLLTSTTVFSGPGDTRIGRSLRLGRSRLSGGDAGADDGIAMLDSNTLMHSGDYLT